MGDWQTNATVMLEGLVVDIMATSAPVVYFLFFFLNALNWGRNRNKNYFFSFFG